MKFSLLIGLRIVSLMLVDNWPRLFLYIFVQLSKLLQPLEVILRNFIDEVN